MRRFTTDLQTPSSKYMGRPPPVSSVAKSASKSAFSNERYSGMGVSVPSSSTKRASSFFRTGTNSYCETRNLKDREVQRAMYAKIINFLSTNGFQSPNLEKMVRSPTRTDFARIFEFIYQALDHRYVLRAKLEDEMPQIFQKLGYPVLLKPSTMQTIGAAHSMHILLGAITWLIDVITISDGLQPQELLLASDDSDGQRTSMGYGYVVKCYKEMMSNGGKWDDEENFKEQTDNFIRIIEEKDDLRARSAELTAKEDLIDEEWNLAQKDPDELDRLRDEHKTIKEDIQKLQVYIEKLKISKKAMADRKESAVSELQAVVANYEATKTKVPEVLNSDQVRELNAERDELNQNIRQLSAEYEILEKSISALQTDLFKEGIQLRELYSAAVRQFEENCRSFDAASKTFVEEMREHSPNSNDFTQFAERIEEYILSLKNFINDQLNEQESEKQKLTRKLESFRTEKANRNSYLNVLQRKLQQKEHYQALKREDWMEEKGKEKMRLDVAENEVKTLKELRSNVMNACEELTKCKKEEQAQRLKIDAMMKNVVVDASRKLSGAVKLCERYRESHRAMREDETVLRSKVEHYIKEMLSTIQSNESQLS